MFLILFHIKIFFFHLSFFYFKSHFRVTGTHFYTTLTTRAKTPRLLTNVRFSRLGDCSHPDADLCTLNSFFFFPKLWGNFVLKGGLTGFYSLDRRTSDIR